MPALTMEPTRTSRCFSPDPMAIPDGPIVPCCAARVAAFPVVNPRNDPARELEIVQKVRREFAGTPNLTLPGIKVFADGVLEIPSQTAAITKPYRNTGKSGDLLFDPARFAELVTAADKQGLIVHVHALGDRAVKESLNGIEAARKANGDS